MTWILITGLIRNTENALIQAREVGRLKAKGIVEGCVFSTWSGEFSAYPEVFEAFKALDSILVESSQPSLRFPGHVLHQSLTLLAGLEYIPDGANVFRMRPDIAPINHIVDEMISGAWMANDLGSGLSPTVFSNRVWAHSGLVMWPFYINDILYFGTKSDVHKLANIDLKHDWEYSELAPEQFFHIGPFVEKNPVLRLYAKIQRGMHSPEKNQRLRDLLWQSDFWYHTLYQSAIELVSNYHIGFTRPSEVESESYLKSFSDHSLTAITAEDAPLRQFQGHGDQYRGNGFHSLGWALALLKGGFKHDEASERLQGCISGSPTPSDLLRSAENLADAFTGEWEDYNPKLRRFDGEIHQAYANRQRVLGLEVSDSSRLLQDEINQLRRALDAARRPT